MVDSSNSVFPTVQSPTTPSEDEKEEDIHTSQTPESMTANLNVNHSTDLEAQLTQLPQPYHQTNPSCPKQCECHSSNRTKNRNNLSTFLSHSIQHDRLLELELLILTFASGIMDATTFSSHAVFVTKQTGNTIFLALAALHHDSVYGTESNIAISISLFLAGAAIFGHAGRMVGPNRRLWLLLSNFIQTLLIFAAAALRHWGSDEKHALGVIALLSFSFGAQISMAMSLRVPDINTTMVTGAIIQLATDDKLFLKRNPARNRRLAFFFSLLGGAFVGAVAGSFEQYASLGILLVSGLKAVVTAMFVFNRPGEGT